MKALDLREKEIAALKNVLRKFPFVTDAKVFGSRATGEATRSSDLDLAVSAPSASPSQWSSLVEAIESAPIIYCIDLVRFDQLENETLQQRIETDGVSLFPLNAN